MPAPRAPATRVLRLTAAGLTAAAAGCKSPNPDYLPFCGNVVCDPQVGEACRSCPQDCEGCDSTQADCGDGACRPAGDESCQTCEPDCGVCLRLPGREGEAEAEAEAEADGAPSRCDDGACDVEAGEDEESCPEDCNGFPGDGLCTFRQGSDNFESAEFCYESPDDCAEFCGGRDACRDLVECAESDGEDLFDVVGCIDDGSPAAQESFSDLYRCWEDACPADCPSDNRDCTDCTCAACRAEADACSASLCAGR